MQHTCQELLEDMGHTALSVDSWLRLFGFNNHCGEYRCCDPTSKYGKNITCRLPHAKQLAISDPCVELLYADKHATLCCKGEEKEKPGRWDICKELAHPRTRRRLGRRRPEGAPPLQRGGVFNLRPELVNAAGTRPRGSAGARV
jgi:hypothetical protein